jgi:hypothetical protein
LIVIAIIAIEKKVPKENLPLQLQEKEALNDRKPLKGNNYGRYISKRNILFFAICVFF